MMPSAAIRSVVETTCQFLGCPDAAALATQYAEESVDLSASPGAIVDAIIDAINRARGIADEHLVTEWCWNA